MATKKQVPIREVRTIQFAPTGQDRIVLNVIEAHLALEYGRGRMDITDSECIRYCVQETGKNFTEAQRKSILRRYGD
jgi:hypothetical protein